MPDLPEFYDCGICGHWHRPEWNGDCREDANRFTTSYLEDTYGNEGDGWTEVPMPETGHAEEFVAKFQAPA